MFIFPRVVSGIRCFERSHSYMKDKEVYSLISKYIEKTISPEERNRLSELVSADRQIREEFASIYNAYALSAFFPSEQDEKEGEIQLKKFKKKFIKYDYLSLFKNFMRYASVICLTLLTAGLFLNKEEKAVEPLVTYEEFITPPGQRAKLKLHDGTTVWLNASSSLRYPNVFTGKTRHVELDGEAFFDVSPDGKMPFVVLTEKLNIKALGTKFNVFAYKERAEFNTFLEEGSVKIYNAANENKALYLNPNEIAELEGIRLVKRPANGKDLLLWMEGIYSFDDLPFKEIIKKLELYYDISIDINNKPLADYRFSGKFRQRDGVVSALRTFQKAYHFSFYKNDELNHITIK